MSDNPTNPSNLAGRPRGSLNQRKRVPQERPRVAIGPTETIRHRLQMNNENFSEALGLHPSAYGGYLQKGFITKIGALAAEALMRRQQASGESTDQLFTLRIIKGTPTAMEVSSLHRMAFDGREFYLIPVKDTQL